MGSSFVVKRVSAHIGYQIYELYHQYYATENGLDGSTTAYISLLYEDGYITDYLYDDLMTFFDNLNNDSKSEQIASLGQLLVDELDVLIQQAKTSELEYIKKKIFK